MAGVEDAGERLVLLGRVSGLYGVRGWVRVHSHTEPREGILRYTPWRILRSGGWEERGVLAGRRHGKTVVVRLDGCEDRDMARELIGAEVYVPRDALGAPDEGEYFWADLVGLQVITVGGVALGQVDALMETGANDVLVVKGDRERLVPFLVGRVVNAVDLDAGTIEVDWDPDF